MKLHAITTAIALAGFAGIAMADKPAQTARVETMPSITVSAAAFECTPPNDHTGHRCDAFNDLIRANFSPRQIGMLFGHRSSYPESLTGGIDRLQRRYQLVVQQYVAAQQAASKTSVAEQ